MKLLLSKIRSYYNYYRFHDRISYQSHAGYRPQRRAWAVFMFIFRRSNLELYNTLQSTCGSFYSDNHRHSSPSGEWRIVNCCTCWPLFQINEQFVRGLVDFNYLEYSPTYALTERIDILKYMLAYWKIRICTYYIYRVQINQICYLPFFSFENEFIRMNFFEFSCLLYDHYVLNINTDPTLFFSNENLLLV